MLSSAEVQGGALGPALASPALALLLRELPSAMADEEEEEEEASRARGANAAGEQLPPSPRSLAGRALTRTRTPNGW